MKTLTLNIPDSVNVIELKMQLAAHLFEKGILSSGQAAEMVGISKRSFIENLSQFGVSVFGENEEDLNALLDA